MSTLFKAGFLITLVAITVLAAGGLSLNAKADPPGGSKLHHDTVMQTLQDDGRFSILVDALEDSGLADSLRKAGPGTVFAPTNDAFRKLADLDGLLKDKARLRTVLRYHIVEFSSIDAHNLADLKTAITRQGSELRFRAEGSDIWVNDARIIDRDLSAGNGTVHAIDSVLFPAETAAEADSDKSVKDHLQFAGDTMYHGLKHGANKIKKTFIGGE
jgi:uncharacterized surface protein with fasciclin (FAS1) repeats